MDRPHAYSQHSDLQRADNLFALQTHLSLTHWSGAPEAVLDVGSGDGRFAVECLLPMLPAHSVGRFVGSDISEVMVRYARERHEAPRRQFVVFDVAAERLPEGFQGGFHHVFSFYALHWVRRQRKAFENMFKILKPGGDIFLTFLAKTDLYQIYQNMSKNERWKIYSKKEYISPYHGFANPEKMLKKLLISTGFHINVCKTEKREFVFPNFDIYKKSVFSVNPIISKLPKEDIAAYTDDFMEEVRRLKCFDISSETCEQDLLTVDYEIFIVHAYKPLR